MLKTRSSSSLLLIAVLLWTLLLPTHAQTPAPGYLAAWGQVPGVAPVGLGNVTAIAGGQSHAVALRADGTVVAWGGDEVGQISVPAGLTDVIALAAGDFHSLALKSRNGYRLGRQRRRTVRCSGRPGGDRRRRRRDASQRGAEGRRNRRRLGIR